MRKTLVFSAILVGLSQPSTGIAGQLKVTLSGGRATVIADDVPVRTILQEWARVGQSRIVNAEKLAGPPVTLRLINVPEQEALEVLLRSASGYLAAQRAVPMANTSQYDRILILATSRPTLTGPAPAPAPQQIGPFPQNPMVQQLVVEPDDDEPNEQAPNPAAMRPPMTAPMPGPIQVTPREGGQPQLMPGQPVAPVTSPRPGMVTPQPAVPGQPPVKPGGGGGR